MLSLESFSLLNHLDSALGGVFPMLISKKLDAQPCAQFIGITPASVSIVWQPVNGARSINQFLNIV
jgi:hypothetical protein